MSERLLSRPRKGTTYRRSQYDRPLRVLWCEDDKDKTKAFRWWGPAGEHARFVQGRYEAALLIDIGRDLVSTDFYGSGPKEWRQPTDDEIERILALNLTYDER